MLLVASYICNLWNLKFFHICVRLKKLVHKREFIIPSVSTVCVFIIHITASPYIAIGFILHCRRKRRFLFCGTLGQRKKSPIFCFNLKIHKAGHTHQGIPERFTCTVWIQLNRSMRDKTVRVSSPVALLYR